jgi:uncharacterized protein YndB with AHSA1/START domain
MRRKLEYLALALVAAIGAVGLWGFSIPAAHTAASQITLAAPPESVYQVVRDLKSLPAWWPEVTSITPVDRNDGWERWKETAHGMGMTIIVREETPNEGLVTTIDTVDHPPFSGTWTYALKLAPGGGTSLTIREVGTVANPYFRVMTRLTGTHSTIDSYLTALGRHFGHDVTPTHVVP